MSTSKMFAYSCRPLILCNGFMKGNKYRMARSKSTVDMTEVKHFAELRHVWWDKNGTMRILHDYIPFRIQMIREGLANIDFKEQSPTLPLQGIKIADIGCGGGILSEALARTGAQVTGIDAAKEMINVAKEHVQLDPEISKRINYIHTSIEEFSSQNEELYDVVIASEVIEHVNHQEYFLKECVKLLKPGGSIFITTQNKTLITGLVAIVLMEYIVKLIPHGTHDWNKFISPNEVQRILENNNCKTNLIYGTMYNPISRHWFKLSCTKLCYILHAVKQEEIDILQEEFFSM